MSFSDPSEDPERRMTAREFLASRESWSASARPIPADKINLRPDKFIPVKGDPAQMSDDEILDATNVIVGPRPALEAAVSIREALEERLITEGHVTREELDRQKEEIRQSVAAAAESLLPEMVPPTEPSCAIVEMSKSYARTPKPEQKHYSTPSEHFGAEMEAKGQKMVEIGRQMQGYTVKDSGERKKFASGMVRDTNDGKVRYDLVFDGPMLDRYADHLTKGAVKYAPRNWMQANGEEELERFRESAVRHFVLWLRNVRDEDHAAAVWYNINGFEYVRDRLIASGELKEGPNASS